MNNVNDEKILYKDLSYKIMNSAFEVQNILGSGLTENIYEEALCHEFDLEWIKYKRQVPVDIFYKNKQIGRYVIDLIVENQIVLELKSVSALHESHDAQIISYIKATKLKLGILINFGQAKVEYKRILNSDLVNIT